MAIRFFDMFAGIGGFRSGLEAVGGFECIGHCEIDKKANQAYNAIYQPKGEIYFEDATKIDTNDLPDIDLICAGFPCQSFSVAGKRLGFRDDTRGTLFFEVARIAEAKRPPLLLLENVPGLLSHDGGRTLFTIFSTLVELGYKNFLGYRKGADGKPEIDPEEAETIRFIYERFLAGDSLSGIAQKLNDLQVPTPSGKGLWQNSTIQSILSNEKYKGDAIINKTYIKDCLSKKVMVNNGERPKYYVENNHPAIIDAVTFGRVQEELARRSGKPKTKQVGTKTEQGKYSSKYAMTELLVCGECKTPYRRCTWTVKGQKKIVWRCINRLDFGKKYCHNSPTVEESILQRAVMRAIMETAQQNLGVLQTLKVHIGMGLQSEQTEDNSMELQIRIAEIDAEFKAMLAKISTDTVDAFDEEKAKRLMDEKAHLQQQLGNIRDGQLKREQTQSRLDDIYTILDGLKNRPMEYDEQIVRQLLECITVDSKEQITVIFVGGLKVMQPLID